MEVPIADRVAAEVQGLFEACREWGEAEDLAHFLWGQRAKRYPVPDGYARYTRAVMRHALHDTLKRSGTSNESAPSVTLIDSCCGVTT